MSGHRKKRKVIVSMPLDWKIFITNQVQIEVLPNAYTWERAAR